MHKEVSVPALLQYNRIKFVRILICSLWSNIGFQVTEGLSHLDIKILIKIQVKKENR